jgi:hypothetical protein
MLHSLPPPTSWLYFVGLVICRFMNRSYNGCMASYVCWLIKEQTL